jgi:hypothetical protein
LKSDAISEVQEAPDARPLPPVQGHLRFEVSLPTPAAPVLTDITLKPFPAR